MSEEKVDRRVQRTRELLRNTLVRLIREKDYDEITIQDITNRANLGRTTFYLHYQSKDDLLLDHHADFTTSLNLSQLSREQLLSATPQTEMITFLHRFSEGKFIYLAIRNAKDFHVIMRGIREQMTNVLAASLEAAYPDTPPTIPLPVLATYIVGAQLGLVDWWLTNHTGYTPQDIAAILQQLQRAAIRDAYRIPP